MTASKKPQLVPLDAFVICEHMHMGAGATQCLMRCLSKHPAVRSYGQATYHERSGYDVQALDHLRAGKINTIFIDPAFTADGHCASGPVEFIKQVRTEYPMTVFVLYTWDRCRDEFVEKNPEFRHYFYLPHLDFHRDAKDSSKLVDETLQRCGEWHRTRYEYDVALSFAGEDRPFAEALARLLKRRGARVFYDKDEQSDLLGKNLYEHLADVYCDRSRYCVLLASKDYVRKMWTSHERRSAQERALRQRGEEYILPIRVDDTRLPAIPETIAYAKATDGAASIAKLIATKLWMDGSTRSKGHIGIGGRLY